MEKYLRVQDKLDPDSVLPTGDKLDIVPFLGTWWNTNHATRGIPKVVLSGKEDGLMVQTFGADQDNVHDLGEVPADVIYADRSCITRSWRRAASTPRKHASRPTRSASRSCATIPLFTST